MFLDIKRTDFQEATLKHCGGPQPHQIFKVGSAVGSACAKQYGLGLTLNSYQYSFVEIQSNIECLQFSKQDQKIFDRVLFPRGPNTNMK